MWESFYNYYISYSINDIEISCHANWEVLIQMIRLASLIKIMWTMTKNVYIFFQMGTVKF